MGIRESVEILFGGHIGERIDPDRRSIPPGEIRHLLKTAPPLEGLQKLEDRHLGIAPDDGIDLGKVIQDLVMKEACRVSTQKDEGLRSSFLQFPCNPHHIIGLGMEVEGQGNHLHALPLQKGERGECPPLDPLQAEVEDLGSISFPVDQIGEAECAHGNEIGGHVLAIGLVMIGKLRNMNEEEVERIHHLIR